MIRLPVFLVLTTLLIIHHHWVSTYKFVDCPKEKGGCPPITVLDNCNEWKYPERTKMESIQLGSRQIFTAAVVILLCDAHIQIPQGWRKLRQYFETTKKPQTEYRESYRLLTNEELEGTFTVITETQM